MLAQGGCCAASRRCHKHGTYAQRNPQTLCTVMKRKAITEFFATSKKGSTGQRSVSGAAGPQADTQAGDESRAALCKHPGLDPSTQPSKKTANVESNIAAGSPRFQGDVQLDFLWACGDGCLTGDCAVCIIVHLYNVQGAAHFQWCYRNVDALQVQRQPQQLPQARAR